MGVYNLPPFLGIIRNVDTDPDENVDGDLINWVAAERLWKRITQSALGNGHNHDDRYFTESEFIDVSTGTPDAGKPVKLGAKGRLSGTMRHIRALATKTASYVMSINDEVSLADASAGPITITLPPIGPSTGLVYHIKRINDDTSDNVTVVGIVN